MKRIAQKSIMVGTILTMVILGMGCLGADQQSPATGIATAQYTESPVAGQNITISPATATATTGPGTGLPVQEENMTINYPTNATVAQGAESFVPGQNRIINQTQDNATIDMELNNLMIVELPDPSLSGGVLSTNVSPGLQVTDEGINVRYFYLNGTPTAVEDVAYKQTWTHTWNVIAKDTGVQTMKVYVTFPPYGENAPQERFNLTLFVK